MKINNINDNYLDELENEEYKYKYKKRDKKMKESFTFEDLLNEKMRMQFMKYMDK